MLYSSHTCYAAAERAKLQASLDAISTTQSSSTVEVQTLKQRVEETEREKRDLMGVVSRLQEDAAQRDAEIQTLRTDLKQARQEHQALERQVRELTSTETSTKVCDVARGGNASAHAFTVQTRFAVTTT